MKKIPVKNILLLLIPAFVFACSGTKKIVQSQEIISEKTKDADKAEELPLEEQKQMQFDYMFLEALKEKSIGNQQQALQLLTGCLEIDPGSSAAMYEIATIQVENNDFTAATQLLEKAVQINKENKWYRLFLAQVYQQTRKLDEAAVIYNELLEKEPENPEYLFMYATLLSSSGKVMEAIEAYEKLEEKTGVNEQISLSKQHLYAESGQIEKAFEEIEKLIEYDPEEPRYYGLMADFYQSRGDSESALKYYRKIQEIDPENEFVHFSLANFYLQNGDNDKAFEEAKTGFRSKDIDLPTKLQLYLIFTANGSKSGISSEQEKELTKILAEEHPGEYLVYTARAESLMKNGNLKEARDELLKALEIEKGDYIIWERIFFLDNDLQDWENLYKHTGMALELFPNQAQVYFFSAISSIQLKNYSEAVALSDEGILFVADNKRLEAQFLMLKGEALQKLGNKTEAFKLFDKSIEMDPDNFVALNNYAYYLSLTGENLDKAEKMSGKVIEHFPDNSTYLDTYAWVLFKKGEYRLAKFYMESAIKNEENISGTLLEHYGDILYKLEQFDKAILYWEKAREKGDVSEILEKKIREKKYFEE